MEQKSLRRAIFLISYTAVLAVAVFHFQEVWAFFQETAQVFMPFFLGFAIAFVLSQPCEFLQKTLETRFPKWKKGLCNGMAVGLTYFGLFFLLYALISVVIPKLTDSVSIFMDSLKVYTANMQTWLSGLAEKTDNELIAEVSVDLSSLFDYLSTYLEKFLSTLLSSFSVAAAQVAAVTGGVFSVLYNLVVALVFSAYMLGDRKNLIRQCKRVLYAYAPKKVADNVTFVADLAGNTFSKFVAGQLLEACILGGLCAIGMLFIMADYAMLIGIIVGISSLVPVAGAYIGGGFCFLLLFMISPMKSVVFLVFLVILQQFEGNVIYPRVVGSSIGLPGLWVVFAVIMGGGMFGLWGVLLSVPCVSVLYALLRLDIQRHEEKKG